MKNSPISFKSSYGVESNGRTVMGYLASFGNKDLDGDVLWQGCFSKSLSERGVGSNSHRKIAFLYQHDMKKPLGRFTTLAEDSKGLYYEAVLDEITLADDVLTQIKSGTLNQHSIGFQYVSDKIQYDKDADVYNVKEVNLYEGSIVTMGMNDNTPITGIKSTTDVMNELRKETDLILKGMDYDKEYEIRSIIHRYMTLASAEPSYKGTLTTDKPFDWEYIFNNLKQQ